MKAVVQRVKSASLTVDGKLISETGAGLVVYLGVGRGDTEKECETTARKICNMRIFEDGAGKMNFSVQRHGRRGASCVAVYALRRREKG